VKKVQFKLGVTEDELKRFVCSPTKRAVIDAVRQMQQQQGLSIGDIIVARDRKDKKFQMMDVNVVQKYVVVHKEECGMVYCKKILKSGKLGNGLNLPCMFDERWEFVIDPDLAEHQILDQEEHYDATEKLRAIERVKNRIKRQNLKIRENFKLPEQKGTDYPAMWNFIQNKLKPGVVFWRFRYYDSPVEQYEVLSVDEVPLDLTQTKNSWGGGMSSGRDQHLKDGGINSKFLVKTKVLNAASLQNWYVKADPWTMSDWDHYPIYLTEPQTYEKALLK
jgi:hypothetical protein